MKEQLAKMLEGLAPGETFILGYDLFDSIWPPGGSGPKGNERFLLVRRESQMRHQQLSGPADYCSRQASACDRITSET
jgi:hypothetical protein